MKRKLITLGGIICLVLTLVACAAPAPTPKPTPTPAPAPAPSPAPSPAPAAPSITHISILSYPMGGGAYVIAYGFSTIVNKRSPWLKATAVETSGNDENAKFIVEPEYKKSAVAHCVSPTWYMAKQGVAPFKQGDLRLLFKEYRGAAAMATLDPNIKKFPDDLVGKRIGLLSKTSSTTIDYENIFKAAGIYDKVKISYGSWDVGKNGLLDKTLDAAVFGCNFTEKPDKVEAVPVPAHLELIATAKDRLHYLDTPVELINKASEISPWKVLSVKVPAGTLMPTQPEFTSESTYNIYMCHADLDEKVVYEFIRCIYDYNDELVKINKQLEPIVKEGLYSVPFGPEFWHPGAVKFYKDKGIQNKAL